MTTTVNPKGESTPTSVSLSSLVSPSDLAGQASIAGPSIELTTESKCASALSPFCVKLILCVFSDRVCVTEKAGNYPRVKVNLIKLKIKVKPG